VAAGGGLARVCGGASMDGFDVRPDPGDFPVAHADVGR